MAAPILYDWELSLPAYAVRLGAALMGVEIERCPVDVAPGRETEREAFLTLTPFARLPVLVDGGVTARSVAGALSHLARRHAPDWLPDDVAVQDWLSFAARDLWPAEAARDAALIETAHPFADPEAAARPALRVLEFHLHAHGDWLAAGRPSIADIAVFPPVALAVDYGEVLTDYPALRGWTRRVRALPGFVAMPGVPEFL
jgi:glutathione S-transferase